MTEVLKTLHECSSKCAVFSVIDGYGSVSDDWLPMTWMMSTSRNNCTILYNPDYSKLSSSDLDRKVSSTFDSIKITPVESDFLEQSTRNQANSYGWSTGEDW